MKQKTKRERQLTPLTLELYRAGSSPIEVARAEGVDPTTVTQVMKGLTAARRIRRIARILKRRVEEIWAA